MTSKPKNESTTNAKKPAAKAKKPNIADYIPLVERVAKVEYRRIPSHMVDFHELVSIGAMAIQGLLKNKTAEQIAKLNISYMATATRWAIRNELRSRYKWYTLKHTKSQEEDAEPPAGAAAGATGGEGEATTESGPENVRETIYETILSIEGISEGSDGESSYDFIKDEGSTPEERLEVVELGRAIKRAIESLPPKERAIMEYRFYRNMQVKDIASLVGLSSSRITRIVQASLDLVRENLKEQNQLD
ncbi:MAG: sigma-70 family RNA polymerase sigma factor [Candidatus Melainabacteria bacterium]